MQKTSLTTIAVVSAVGVWVSGCTGQIPSSFRLQQQNQTFNADLNVNTKVDLLFVVDNSSSMDVEQANLRQGLAGFAKKYMQPTWDIQVAVITTDTYLANTQYSNFLSEVIPGTVGWQSPYIHGRTAPWVQPTKWNISPVDSTGTFTNGVTYNDLVPAWGSNYAKLLPGYHDGPITAFCFEGQSYFLNGVTNCRVRDNNPSIYTYTNGTDTTDCLNPTGSETSTTQCLNTVENDTVHSGTALIKTMPSTALTGSALTAWTNQLANEFMINTSTGSAGHGSERGMQSVLQMINDNELGTGTQKLFRPGSIRGIIFLSDEDDQTMYPETTVTSSFTPFSHYFCDQNSLLAHNSSTAITGTNGYCCTGSSCTFGQTIPPNTNFPDGTTSGSSGMSALACPSKTVTDSTGGSYTYTVSICPNTHYLVPVSTIKSTLDSFFTNLDGSTSTNANYFVTAITPMLANTISTIQSSRHSDDSAAGYVWNLATDRGDRYIQLANQVGGYSNTYDIGAGTTDYSPVLDAIGDAIIQQESTFTLSRAPTSQEDMIVTLVHADGSSQIIPPSEYTISGKSIIIAESVVLTFSATDKIEINYQPKSVQ